jgi:hypothetical protein
MSASAALPRRPVDPAETSEKLPLMRTFSARGFGWMQPMELRLQLLSTGTTAALLSAAPFYDGILCQRNPLCKRKSLGSTSVISVVRSCDHAHYRDEQAPLLRNHRRAAIGILIRRAI